MAKNNVDMIKINNYDRSEIMKYFQGETKGIFSFFKRLLSNKNTEQIYDELLSEDIKCLEKVALRKLGVVNEEVQIIQPIKVLGPDQSEEFADKENVLNSNDEYMLIKLLLKIITLPLKLILSLLKKKLGVNGEYESIQKYRTGSDDKVRYTIVQTNMFFFSEEQVYVYRVVYDICSGEIFEERTSEYFYRDIDTVRTKEKVYNLFTATEKIKRRYQYFKLVVGSGTYSSAVVDSSTEILEEQIMAMRSLIRNKKQEMK